MLRFKYIVRMRFNVHKLLESMWMLTNFIFYISPYYI